MDPDVLGHYELGVERDRLSAGRSGRIEFARTKELVERLVPEPPGRVLDVGGGPGPYAEWLAGRGYDVRLIDPVPLHVEEASTRARRSKQPFAVELGDARRLRAEDGSIDAVLMLGPLYHLTRREDRVLALSEAGRVLRPGGVVLAAAISRFASLLGGMKDGYLADPAFRRIVELDLASGQHRNPTPNPEYFTTAYFHDPDELARRARGGGARA